MRAGGRSEYTFAGFPTGNLQDHERRPFGLVAFSVGRHGVGAIQRSNRGPIVRLAVTPLGSSSRSTSAVASAVVDYLEGDRRTPGSALLHARSAGESREAVNYYADSIEGPGRWLGAGAVFRRLAGSVDRDSFQRVLEGRHPVTGERLVTARGSSKRRQLAVGSAARFDDNGEALYSVSDVARLLSVTKRDVGEMIASARDGERRSDDLSWIDACEHRGSGLLIPDREVSRHLDGAASLISAESIRDSGAPDDLLSVPEAARLLGLTRQYVNRLCVAGERLDPLAARQIAHLPSCRVSRRGTLKIRRDDLTVFAQGRKAPIARVGFDVTLTVEKSIGLLAMLSTGNRQALVVRALHRANEVAMDYLDQYASVARRRGTVVRTEGLLIASYFHGTSRSLDPHPHYHNVIAYAVVDEDGGVRTLDARGLYRHAPAAANLATAAARWELRQLGLGWWRRDDGVWEIAGVDRAVIREFSQRRQEMDEVRSALEERLGRRVTHVEENTIAKSTRSSKRSTDPIALKREWLSRADRVGFDLDACFDRADQALSYDVLPLAMQRQLFDDLVDAATGLCSRSNTFHRADVIGGIVDWSILDESGQRIKVLLPPAEVERVAEHFCACDLIVQIDDDRPTIQRSDGRTVRGGPTEPVFTSVELLDVQQQLLELVRSGVAINSAVVPDDIIARVLDEHPSLSHEQRTLVEEWLTSGDRVQCAIGRAGSGKTTTMQVASIAWQAAGCRVRGAAIKGEAARQLGHDAGIDADTVAMLLAQSRAGARVLDSLTVLIVDEASTIGDRDLLELCHLAIDTGATLRLIGDTAQHSSVPTGGTFGELVCIHADRTPQLTAVHRMTNTGERRRADLVRDGQIDDALAELESSGQLVVTENDGEMYAAVVERWYEQRIAGRSHPMVHGRNRERRLLNSLAQGLLTVDGDIDPAVFVQLADGRRLCMGDEVIARHGDRSVFALGDRSSWLRNGTTGRVRAIRTSDNPLHDEIDIAMDDAVLTCGRATFDREGGGIDLGYAVTSYAVQGSTSDVSTSSISTTTTRSELYVDMTRGRHENRLFATRRESSDQEFGERLPRLDDELVRTLAARLARGNARTALATDPAAPGTHVRGMGSSLAELHGEQQRDNAGVELERAIDNKAAAIRRIAIHEPTAGIERVLPPKPTSPALRERWFQIVGTIAVYVARHEPDVRHDQAGLAGVIGLRPEGDGGAEWDQIRSDTRDLSCRALTRDLLDLPSRLPDPEFEVVLHDRPAWLNEYVGRVADAGNLASIDLERTADLLHEVHRWRVENDLVDTASPGETLGPNPSDPAQRLRYRALQARLIRSMSNTGRGRER